MIIAKGQFSSQSDTQKRLRVNDYIRSSSIFLINENNEKIGEISLNQAKDYAHDAGLDLVEVAPQSSPPVCRIMDYGKWKYQQRKKEQKAKSNSKQSELKEVRLRPKIDIHDLQIKIGKATEFLTAGHKVQFSMIFRGREMAHRELGINVMNNISAQLESMSKIESPARMMGRRMNMMLSPDNASAQKTKKQPKPTKTTTKPQANTTP